MTLVQKILSFLGKVDDRTPKLIERTFSVGVWDLFCRTKFHTRYAGKPSNTGR
jgi:hypothetical protein